MWDYTDKVMDHFKNPRNVGEVPNADGTGQVGSLVCGDALKLTIKVDKTTETITDIKFKTFGCASAIASSSVITEMAKGKTLAQAAEITNKDIAAQLGERRQCIRQLDQASASPRSWSASCRCLRIASSDPAPRVASRSATLSTVTSTCAGSQARM